MFTQEDHQALTSGFNFCKRDNSDTYLITGPDSKRYLQGRLTQDIEKPGRSLLLTPQGKIQAHFRIASIGEEYLLISDPIEEESLSSALFQFKVADWVEFAAYPRLRYSLRGKQSLECLGVDYRGAAELEIKGNSMLLVANPIGSTSGYECYSDAPIEELFISLGGREISEELLEVNRIESAYPEFGKDITEKNTPGDINVDELVSFSKGCYTGQEVVEKQIALGKANKKLLVLRGKGSPPAPSDIIKTSDGDKAGEITSVASYPWNDRFVCLAFVKAKALEHNSWYCGDTELHS